jgi:BirA family transcriptional regulator, biotin operon repressor / biotin---[acetyl-CoA-carboxylase] ligase
MPDRRAERNPNAFDLAHLRRDLKPFRLHWFPRLRSTNDHAAAMRKRGELYAPAVVLTGHQLAGRGRGANTWWSAADGVLTVTFAMPIEEHLAAYQIPLAAGLAVRNAAAELTTHDSIALKWPNDVLHDGRKLAGLLCERVHHVDLIGVGLNVNVETKEAPQQLRSRLTSLRHVTGEPFDMTDALLCVAHHLHRTLSLRKEHPFPAILREYDCHHALVGRQVRVIGSAEEPVVSGVCQGLDDLGRLVLRDGRTTRRVIAGHVEMI